MPAPRIAASSSGSAGLADAAQLALLPPPPSRRPGASERTAPSAPATSAVEPHPAAEACANGLVAPGAPPRDLACMLGDVGYYRARDDDFRQRHPDLAPPAYYLAYGEKYAHRFTEETMAQLGPQGRAWLQQVFVVLQQSLEARRAQDPAAFDALERQPEAFQRMAYATHEAAYLEAGLARLSGPELVAIGLTPDLRDLLAPDGLEQAAAVMGPVLLEKGLHPEAALAAEAEELLRRARLELCPPSR